MDTLVVLSTLIASALSLLAGAIGAWRWYRVESSRGFWIMLRIAQAAAIGVALETGVLLAAGSRPSEDLFYLYALLALAVGLIGEQLRVASAETVLAARGLQDAQEVGALAADEQRAIVVAITRREMGVMALTALVVCFLELRAATTAHGF